MRINIITYSLLVGALFLPYPSFANDYERYQAVPLGSGGIFIIDSKDGHVWTWSNRGGHAANGKSLSIEYQGSVRSNMDVKKKTNLDLEHNSHASSTGITNEDGEVRY